MNVVIVDYKAGNLFSVEQACKTVGLNSVISSAPQDILKADALILPGVGAFGEAMKNLYDLGLVHPLKEFAASKRPFMGICLGMQLLFSGSDEFGENEGLSLVEGTVVKFPGAGSQGARIKIPQIGWNRIYQPASRGDRPWQGTPLQPIASGEFMYFVHSYYVCPSHEADILSVSDYEGIQYCSAVMKGNIFAAQFHPEKSAREGLKIYAYWAESMQRG